MAEVFKFQRKDKAFFNVDIDGTLLTLPIGQSMSLELFEKIANITKIAQKARASDIDNLERLENGVELGKCLHAQGFQLFFHNLYIPFSVRIKNKKIAKYCYLTIEKYIDFQKFTAVYFFRVLC